MAGQAWKEKALAVHNELRARHGAPPLQWSDECYEFARRQANECSQFHCLRHGNYEGASGRVHGQNAFMAPAAEDPEAVVKAWYSELDVRGHDFGKDSQMGTAHFSQVVWAGSEYLGMATSEDGLYIFANYLPAGNVAGDFHRHVFPAGTAAQERPPASTSVGGDVADGTTHVRMQLSSWREEALRVHNELRAKHGAPPLAWSNECYKLALRQAQACASSRSLKDGSYEGASGHHGQNAFMASPAVSSPVVAVLAWYSELETPGYDFNCDHQMGISHFAQVVWLDSEFVGMAESDDGLYIFANYLPSGNIVGQYRKNVLPLGNAPQGQDRDGHAAALGEVLVNPRAPELKVSASSMTPELKDLFEVCPYDEVRHFAEETFEQGGEIIVTSAAGFVQVVSIIGDVKKSRGGRWRFGSGIAREFSPPPTPPPEREVPPPRAPPIAPIPAAELEAHVAKWVEDIVGESRGEQTTHEWLRSGTVLCHLLNAIKPGTVPRVNAMNAPFKHMENITYFMDGARALGVPEYAMFGTPDLYEDKSMDAVLRCLFTLGGAVQVHVPGFPGPKLGIPLQELKDERREKGVANLSAGLQGSMERTRQTSGAGMRTFESQF